MKAYKHYVSGLVVVTMVVGLVLVTTPPISGHADATYKKSRWATRLNKGELSVRGTGHGSWGKRWIRIATGVESYQEAGTSKGPVLIYKLKGKPNWHTVQLHSATGEESQERSFTKRVKLLRAGRYGVLIRVGPKNCYDLSWNRLRPIHCDSRRFK